jgi:hypothetical protein
MKMSILRRNYRAAKFGIFVTLACSASVAAAVEQCDLFLKIGGQLKNPAQLQLEKQKETEWSSLSFPGFDDCIVSLNRDGSHDYECENPFPSSRDSIKFLQDFIDESLRPCASREGLRVSTDLTPILKPGEIPSGQSYSVLAFVLGEPEVGGKTVFVHIDATFSGFESDGRLRHTHRVTLRITN